MFLITAYISHTYEPAGFGSYHINGPYIYILYLYFKTVNSFMFLITVHTYEPAEFGSYHINDQRRLRRVCIIAVSIESSLLVHVEVNP